MKTIEKFDVLSVAKIYALLIGILGLILAILQIALMLIFAPTLPIDYLGMFLEVLLWFVFGFVVGGLFAWLYNKLAPKIGGVKLKLK